MSYVPGPDQGGVNPRGKYAKSAKSKWLLIPQNLLE